MSLIADSLKKAQTEREQEPGHWANTVLRVKEETTPRFPKSLMIAVATVPVVFLGIWFVLIPGMSEQSVVTQTADLSNQTQETGVLETSLNTSSNNKNDVQGSGEVGGEDPIMEVTEKPVHPVESTVAPVPEEPILVSSVAPEKGQKDFHVEVNTEKSSVSGSTLQNNNANDTLEPVIQQNSLEKENIHANEKTPVGQKEKEETHLVPAVIVTPVTKQVALEEQPKPVFVPFTKSQSPLEKVASLTKGIPQEPVLVPIQMETKVEVEEPPATTPVEKKNVTTIESDSIKVQVTADENSTENSGTQVAKVDYESQKSGDISVVPDQDFLETLSKTQGLNVDQRSLNEKSRYFNIAVYHHKKKDFFEALKFYAKAAKLDPGNAQIFNNRALVYQKLGQRKAAIEELLHAIHIDSKYVKAYNNLGLLYYYSGNTLGAIKSFEQAVEIDPRNVESYNNLAILHKQQKQYAQAKNLYRKVILLEPSQAEAHYNLALLYEETGELSSALKYYRLFVKTGAGSRPALALQVREHIKKLEELSRS